jgi:hypothetical protein
MVDHAHLGQAQVAYPRPRVDEHIVIKQHRSGAQVASDTAATA